MTIFVNDVIGMTALEVEMYRYNRKEMIGEFVTINGRKGYITSIEKKEKKIITALYTPFYDPNREVRFNTIVGNIHWE
ncbi:MAG: hypothetical protein IJ424_07305 [Oscillospiraceae bacterium]|nr:hypothetical protein [Oscillospiraceae bacterium]